MSLWKKTDLQTSAPKWKNLMTPAKANGEVAYNNTTIGSFTAKQVDGVFAANSSEAKTAGKHISPGWMHVRQGTGPITNLVVSNDGASFANLAVGTISNGTSAASFRVVVNAIGHVQSLLLDNGGAGFINTGALTLVQPANGISQANISAGGLGYTVNDYVSFSNGQINATANVATVNSLGGITAIAFTSGGRGFTGTPNQAVPTITVANQHINSITAGTIVTPGIGYTNGDIGKWSNTAVVNATFTVGTDGNGAITSITFTAIGRGFDGNAAHVFSAAFTNSAGGTTGGSGANVMAATFNASGASIVANTVSFGTGAGLRVTPTLGGRAGRVHYESLVAIRTMAQNSAPTWPGSA